MNLKARLFVYILLIALVCLTTSAYYVLYQTDRQALFEANQTAMRIERQLKEQLLEMFQRYDLSRQFPDADSWQEIQEIPGSCIQFLSRSQSRQRSLCNEGSEADTNYPGWFGALYGHLFHPDLEVRKAVNFNAMQYGTILVSLNVQMETARAWSNLRAVIDILIVTIATLCLLMFFTLNLLLRPAQQIVNGLEKMRQGKLDWRLPAFDIPEWKRTSEAINALAEKQQLTLAENRHLALKLMNVQEEEHRYLSRELHDEFGQCLAGINAVTTSIAQSARQHCPQLIDEVNSISRISAHMMTTLRNLLTRLRPVNVDELGLKQSLKQLVRSWNQRSGNRTHYELCMEGELENLPEPLPANIYRIVQECLTNIAKHARANTASINLQRPSHACLALCIVDDGIASKLDSFRNSGGMGLLGIDERVDALGGTLTFETQANGGLVVNISLPVTTEKPDHD